MHCRHCGRTMTSGESFSGRARPWWCTGCGYTPGRCRCEPIGAASAKVADQPPPIPSDRPAVWDLVIADMRDRDAVGRERYGTPLQPHNGRDALVDAYQEALDLAVYLRQAIAERDGAV